MPPGPPPWAGAGGLTRVVRRADTHVVVDPVHAGGIVLTVVVLAVVWVDLTALALKAQRAGAALGMCGKRRKGVGGVTESGVGLGWQKRRLGGDN